VGGSYAALHFSKNTVIFVPGFLGFSRSQHLRAAFFMPKNRQVKRSPPRRPIPQAQRSRGRHGRAAAQIKTVSDSEHHYF